MTNIYVYIFIEFYPSMKRIVRKYGNAIALCWVSTCAEHATLLICAIYCGRIDTI